MIFFASNSFNFFLFAVVVVVISSISDFRSLEIFFRQLRRHLSGDFGVGGVMQDAGYDGGRTPKNRALSSENSHEPPPPPKDFVRIYSMRFCPYAHRLRLVAAAENVAHEIVNIDLRKKPSWYVRLTDNGIFPAAEFPQDGAAGNDGRGKVITGSIEAAREIAALKGRSRESAAAAAAAADEKLRFFDSVLVPSFGAVLVSGASNSGALTQFEEHLARLEEWLDEKPASSSSFLELMIWPWIHRLPVLQGIAGYQLPKDRFVKLRRWISMMESKPEVASTSNDLGAEIRYYETYLAGNPDVDAGLNEARD